MKWIDRQGDLDEAIRSIASDDRIAMDTEADSLHSYFDKVCLVQITAGGDDWIIDPLADIDLGSALGPLLEDRSKLKILHGADYDLRILHRDFGIRIRNIFDTMVAAQLLGVPGVGLASLLSAYFDVQLDKKHQRADWARRPLPEEMLRYAAMDTQYLKELASRLEEQLRARDRWEWAVEEFERLEEISWREPEPEAEGFRRMKKIGKLSRRSLGVLSKLWDWRDAEARAADKPAFRILNNEALIAIAETMPSSPSELSAIRGFSHWHQRRFGRELLRIVQQVRTMPEDELPERAAGRPWIRDRDLESRVEKLRKVRDRISAELEIDSAVLAPRHVLTAVAQLESPDEPALEQIPAMRRWQRRLLAQPLLDALA